MRIMNSDGTAFTANDIRVNTTTTADQSAPSVAVLADQKIVVVWADYSGTYSNIRGRVYHSDGTVSTLGDFRVEKTDAFGMHERNPVVAALPDGRFVVVYEELSFVTGGKFLRARVLNADGTADLNPITFRQEFVFLGTEASVAERVPSVAVLNDGQVAVTWGSTRASFSTSQQGPAFDAEGGRVAEQAANGTIAVDLSGSDLTFSLLDDSGGRFTLVGSSIVVADGALIDFETSASHTVVVKATDAFGNSRVETLVISIFKANGAPSGTPTVMLASGTEDVAYTVSAADLLQGFSDVDGDTLSVANLTSSSGTVTSNGDGTFTISAPLNANGLVTLTYNVTDGKGGVLTGQTRTFTRAAANDAPTGAPTATLAAGTQEVAYAVSAADLLQGFSDVDGDTLSVVNLTSSSGTVTNNGDGTFTISAPLDANGAVTLTYDVTDGNGGTVTGQTQTFTRSTPNDGPTGSPTATLASGTEDQAYTVSAVDLLAGFSDAEGDTLSVANLTSSSGTVTNNGDGTFTISAPANANGLVTLTYDVSGWQRRHGDGPDPHVHARCRQRCSHRSADGDAGVRHGRSVLCRLGVGSAAGLLGRGRRYAVGGEPDLIERDGQQ